MSRNRRPLGTFVGQFAGWRTAFLLLALPSLAATRAAVLKNLLRRPGVRSGLVVTFLVAAAAGLLPFAGPAGGFVLLIGWGLGYGAVPWSRR
ncbi:hypothetical protein OHS18_02790 [Amycolatopsis sp. NBC_00355]|uniref:hypothetical protein n=1 Tax=Amycolatopsis sp. NBC_00355 TaxID=2975957 RepID=UPI002E26BA93